LALISGTRLGPYEILSPLGAGGMGEVFRARDTRLERLVAVKILPQELAANPELRERFLREARAISNLQHPHICTLHDVGEHAGTSYLVMELLEGEIEGFEPAADHRLIFCRHRTSSPDRDLRNQMRVERANSPQ
jgi:serine/threonine protein kinase